MWTVAEEHKVSSTVKLSCDYCNTGKTSWMCQSGSGSHWGCPRVVASVLCGNVEVQVAGLSTYLRHSKSETLG